MNNNQQQVFNYILNEYPQHQAPFSHQQIDDWKDQPLKGVKILHHNPVVKNTLLKLLPLVVSGAEVIVTNPSFLEPSEQAIELVHQLGLVYEPDFTALNGEDYDIFLDAGAELFQHIGKPKQAVVELTGSGDDFYREANIDFPVLSIDKSLCKQLETTLGCGDGIYKGIEQLLGYSIKDKSCLVFGFGKIGRGVANHFTSNKQIVRVVEADNSQLEAISAHNLEAINAMDKASVQQALEQTDIVITATGKENVISVYPKQWFNGKILANAGVRDEYGEQFTEADVLNNKKACNFVLVEPTAIEYIDPEFYAHNLGAELLVNGHYTNGVHNLPKEIDRDIFEKWCAHYQRDTNEVLSWFIDFYGEQ